MLILLTLKKFKGATIWQQNCNHYCLSRESLLKGRICTVDLLVLISSDQLLSILKLYFLLFTKQPILVRWSIVLSLPLQQEFPGLYVGDWEKTIYLRRSTVLSLPHQQEFPGLSVGDWQKAMYLFYLLFSTILEC
jgi:hypothetical protein